MVDTSRIGKGWNNAQRTAHYDRRRCAGLHAILPEPSRPAMVNPDEFDGFSQVS
jgi:hypothetical protein